MAPPMQQMPAFPAAAAAPTPGGMAQLAAQAARQPQQAPVPMEALMQQMPAFPEAGAASGMPPAVLEAAQPAPAAAPLGAPQGSPLGFGVDMSAVAAPRSGGRPAEAPQMLPPVAIEPPEQMAIPPVPPSGDDGRFTNSEATRAFIQSLRGGPGPPSAPAVPTPAGPGNSLLQGASGAGGLQRWLSYFSSANDSVRAREQR